MKSTRFFRQLTTFVITLSMALPLGITKLQTASAAENNKTKSQAYVEAMGKGWNLGNTFDGFNSDDVTKSDETAWGNPVVTKELIKAVKAKGFDSIRIPMTASTRYTLSGGHYVFNANWLKRYKEVVDVAVAEGLYVMINLHHDSWAWLASWDGNKSSAEYKIYSDLWAQLAATFKDEGDKVCFETINEPQFWSGTESEKQNKLDLINRAAYDAIRNSGGNNAARMIVIPTMNTNHEAKNSDPAYNFIAGLNDENIIATVHYYSEWVYSSNLGKTGFDEDLWGGNNYSPRDAANSFYNTIYSKFTAKGIGVVVGEYGLLGDDAGAETNQLGEKLKYYEYMNYLAQAKGISLMMWDNGGFINRNDTKNYSWKQPLVGKVIEAALKGERSSYAKDLNEIYLAYPVDADLQIKLALNANTFKNIEGLSDGKDYTYDAATTTVTLSKDFVNSKFNTLAGNKYGSIADLVMKFSAGADWHQYLIKYATPVLKPAVGTTPTFSIPVNFNGTKLRRATAYSVKPDGSDGDRVGPNAGWWGYLECGNNKAVNADYDKNTINILSNFFNDGSVPATGKIKFTFEFYDGQKLNYILDKSGTNVTGKSVVDVFNVTFDSKGGAVVDNTSLYKDSLIAKPADPAKAGYTFNGWYSDQNGTTKWDFATGKVTSDMTLYAGWTENPSSGDGTTLPQTGSVVDTTVLYLLAAMLIALGSVLAFKKRRINE